MANISVGNRSRDASTVYDFPGFLKPVIRPFMMQKRTTDEDIRKLWRAWGGSFHGPMVEHAIMREDQFLVLMRALIDKTVPGILPSDNITSTESGDAQ